MRTWCGMYGARFVLALALAACVAGCKAPAGGDLATQPKTAARADDGFAQSGSSSAGGYSQGNERRRDQRHGGARSAAPGQFDYYLLTWSWSPEFCYSHPDKPECATGRRFVVHGLWPENSDGGYPEECSDAAGPANPGQYSDLYPDQGLLQHEWQTHGTCSGMQPDAYFSAMRREANSVKIPGPLADVSSRISLSPDQIINGFVQANPGTSAADYNLGCANNYLTQVQLCVDKNLHATACMGVRSCGADTVIVVPPGTARTTGSGGYGGYSGGGSRRRHHADDRGY
ncbi:Ribonuclease I [Bryocella elongata]|uniref:Ribonuclease I n=1 Tax=Bryocella elongata TaxID=863522 RepID=A0A1H5UGX4_9BACT|nr:Ribonuclease I [Bryocella elongata]